MNQQPYQQQMFMPSQRPPSEGKIFAIIALVCFGIAWVSGIASFIPIIGYAILCFALIVHLLGFVFLIIAIVMWK